MIGVAAPFFLKGKTESWNSVLSLSFTILGTIATIATLIIALFLYDKFGINAKFKEKQADTVLELATALKKTQLSASTKGINYLLHVKQATHSNLDIIPSYKADRNKTLLFSTNYEKLLSPILEFYYSYWLPKEIKEKMKFLDIMALVTVDDSSDEQYVKLIINNEKDAFWAQSFPKLSFEMFSINFHNLLKEVNAWLKIHSSIPVDLNI
ncbi:MAG: hypothetical protein ABIN74_03710 [Ferruginibacter sp.]